MTINQSLTPMRNPQPVQVFDQIPTNCVGFDGQVIFVGGIASPAWYQKVNGAWTMYVSGGGSAPYNPAQNARGILPNGSYAAFPPGVTVVSASNTPSASLNVNTGATFTIFDSIALPGGVVGPDGWFELWVDWSCNNSAGTKTLNAVWDNAGSQTNDVQTTNTSSTMVVRIGNRNNAASNIVQSAPHLGGNAASLISLARDLSKEGNCIALWGNLSNSADNMRIERWQLTAHNPPVYSAARLKYGTPIFWGANSHFDDSQSIAMHIAGMKTMGMKVMRITYEGGSSLSTIQNYAAAFQSDGTGLQLFVCLDLSISPDGSVLYASEAAAYAAARSTAQLVASTLAPYNVTMYECGNEMDTKFGINTGDPQGGSPTDFDNTKVSIFRGIQRGAIDGIHAANPAFIAFSNAYTVCSIALGDMMYFGTNPDGSTGHNLVRPDGYSWHNYEDYGPLMGVEMGNTRPWVNIYAYINRRWGGLPIMISEWNGKASDTDPQRANWANRFMYEAYSNRYKYNIAGVMVYELYGGPWNVLDGVANTPVSTFGTTVQTFISANPDNGL